MYSVKFKPNLCGMGGSEVNEKIDNFSYKFEEFIVTNGKWDYGIKRDDTGGWYTFTTNNIEKMLVNICKYFEVDGVVVDNLNPVIYDYV